MRNRLTPLTLIFLAFLLLATACAPARLSQFRSFSQAGVSYVKASEAFLDEAGAAAIKGDTTLLLRARPDLSEAERRKQLLANNRLLRERLLLLNQLKTHGNLLREYFEILGLLADSKAPAPLTASAQNVFAGLSKLAPSLRSASLGGVSIESRLPAVLNLAVAPFKARALENELKERGPAIERELALQEAALTLLSEELRKDLTILANAVETRDLITPFASAPDVPSNWPARRAEILHSQVTSESANAAANAAAKLRAAFQRLASNQLDPAALSSLTAEISALVNLTGAIKTAGANP